LQTETILKSYIKLSKYPVISMVSATKLCQGGVGRGQKESGKAHRDVGRQRRCAERLAQLGSIKNKKIVQKSH
jgi:hypothetical protein